MSKGIECGRVINKERRCGFWVDQKDPLLKPNAERLRSAYFVKKGDRVPNWEPFVMKRSLECILGRSTSDINLSWNLPPKDYVEFVQRVGQDVMPVPLECMSLILPRIGKSEKLDQGNTKHPYKYYSTHAISLETEIVVKGWEDLEKLKVPSQIEIEAKVEKVKSYIKAAEGTKIGVMPTFMCDVVWVGYNLLGMANFCKKLFTERKKVEYIFDFYTEAALKLSEALAELNLPCVYVNSDPCDSHGTIIPPRLMEELWVPRVEQLIKPFKRKRIPMMFHSCGNLTQLVPMLINLGLAAVHPVQPNCNDIYALKKQYGDDICLVGNIDIAGVLRFGTPKEVEKDVKKHIRILAEGGGYVCGSSHTIIDEIPPENYIAMIKAVQKHGLLDVK